jgi:hypothetical protein
MNPEDYKQAWQSQSPGRLTINSELLQKEVRRNQRLFAAIIFWRDVREVGVAVLLVPVWLYMGAKLHLPWAWYLMVPALVWVAGFMVADRMRNKLHQPGPGEPLRQSVESSLAQVTHQIWLLRNVLWWYLLPFTVPALAFFGQVAWLVRSGGWPAALIFAQAITVAVAILVAVYRLNQHAVRRELEPRRQELEVLLANLKEERPAARE